MIKIILEFRLIISLVNPVSSNTFRNPKYQRVARRNFLYFSVTIEKSHYENTHSIKRTLIIDEGRRVIEIYRSQKSSVPLLKKLNITGR